MLACLTQSNKPLPEVSIIKWGGKELHYYNSYYCVIIYDIYAFCAVFKI